MPSVRGIGIRVYRVLRNFWAKLNIAAVFLVDESRFSSGKQTLLLVSHEASRTGAPILALNIGLHLKDRYNLVVVLLKGGALEQEFRSIASHLIVLRNRDRHPSVLKYLVSVLLRARKVTFAIINSIESRDVIRPLAEAGVPPVLLMHEFASYVPAESMREALDWTSEVIFPAQVVAESAFNRHPALRFKRTHVIPQGPCDLSIFESATVSPDEERRLIEAMRPAGQKDVFVVLGAGSVNFRKGIDVFVETAAIARRLAPDLPLHFVWIGHGFDPHHDLVYSNYLAEQIARSDLTGHLIMVDEVSNIAKAYELASVLFLSSRLDPLPNISIDAALRGLPIVCFERASGIAEMMSADPIARETVVPHLDSHAAACAIIALAQDSGRHSNASSAIRRLGLKTFDMPAYISRIEAIGVDALSAMQRGRADAVTILGDQLFDKDIFLPARERHLSRERAVAGFLACWWFRRPCAGFHPEIYAVENPYVVTDGVNPLADYIRKGRPAGSWSHTVIQPGATKFLGSASNLRVGVHAHFYYPELVGGFLEKLSLCTHVCDLLLSTNEAWKAKILEEATEGFCGGKVTIRVMPNKGRDIGPFLTGFKEEIVRDYDIVGHFHGKRSLAVDSRQGDTWREFLWQHLIGGMHPMTDMILARFAAEERLGLVFAEEPHLVNWGDCRPLAEEIAASLGLVKPLPTFFEFPVGTMFWARTRSLAPLFDLNLDWTDYPDEPIAYDGTLLHTLERLLPLVVQSKGFDFATTFVPGVSR